MNTLKGFTQDINYYIFDIINYFYHYLPNIYAFELAGMLFNNKKYFELVGISRRLKNNNGFRRNSNLINIYNDIREFLLCENLITITKNINTHTSWNDIRSVLLIGDTNIYHILEIIIHQVKLWFEVSKKIFNISFDSCDGCDDKLFVIAFLIHKTYGTDESTIRTIVKSVFAKLGKFIYTQYENFIANILNKPLLFVELLNSFGLGVEIKQLNKYVSDVSDILDISDISFNISENLVFNEIENICEFDDKEIIRWTKYYDIENKIYNFILSNHKQHKIIIRCG